MFRLINPPGARPVLPKLRNKPTPLPLPKLPQITYFRANSNIPPTPSPLVQVTNRVENIAKSLNDDAPYRHFCELLVQTSQAPRSRNNAKDFIYATQTLTRFFMENFPAIKHNLTTQDLQDYTWAVYSASTFTRFVRLASDKNRDNDKRDNNWVQNEGIKSAVLHMNGLFLRSELSIDKISAFVLQNHIHSLIGYLLTDEIIRVWECGVISFENEERLKMTYFSDRVLASVLPAAFETKRFTYEECLQIYDANTKGRDFVDENLRASIAKIAIKAQDYNKALDMLDSLTESFVAKKAQHRVFRALGEVHLAFIGDSKDINISKHFFDKVTNFEVKYDLVLKVRQIESLLQNCKAEGEPIDRIAYFWTRTIRFYEQDKKYTVNSRFSVLNNAFFKIFFETYPVLTEDSLSQLKHMIHEYSQVKAIDETFVNTVLTNCTWNNREIFDQLVDSYRVYNVERTEVSYRIALKKAGEIPFSLEEIVGLWNEGLRDLDNRGITYIPVANWAALRDATVLSPLYAEERRGLYYELVKRYKNYMQDKRACQMFLKKWKLHPLELEELVEITYKDDPVFMEGLDLTVPEFKNLRENVDYRGVTGGLAGVLMNEIAQVK